MAVNININVGGNGVNTNSVTNSVTNNVANAHTPIIPTQTTSNNAQATHSKNSIFKTAILVNAAQQTFGYITSNIGKWTGSSRTQQNVNNTLQFAQTVGMIAINPTVGLINLGLNLATTAIDTAWEQKWDRLQSQQALARAGYSSSGEITGRRH